MKNLKEFKALIQRYESITLKEINILFIDNENIMYGIATICTGLGSYNSCTLCIAVDKDAYYETACNSCVYGYFLGCIEDNAELTYNKMVVAHNPRELLTAYRERAKFMRNLLKEKNISFRTLKTI